MELPFCKEDAVGLLLTARKSVKSKTFLLKYVVAMKLGEQNENKNI